VNELKQKIKELLLTPKGWFSFFIANIITSLPWFIPLSFGFIFNNQTAYIISASIWGFFMLPFTPIWVLNIIIALQINNLLDCSKRKTPTQERN
jgi:hypothetical protein